jgi:hypothetical protein
MEGMIDLAFFSASVTLSILLLTIPLHDLPSPKALARQMLMTLVETRPENFSYEFLGISRTLRFKTYGQLLSELALLDFPQSFRDRLIEELENLLDNFLPLRYRLVFRDGTRGLEVGKGEGRLLCQEEILLTIPSLPPRVAELELQLYA